MVVNIKWDEVIDGYATRDITNINVDEYADITFSLEFRLEHLEEKLKEYKESEDERLREFIPKTQVKIKRLKRLIEIMQ